MFPKIDSMGMLVTKIDWSATAVTLILGNMESCNVPNSETIQSNSLFTNTYFFCQTPVVLHQRGTSQFQIAIQAVQKTIGLESLCLHTVRALPPATLWWHLAWLSVFLCIFAI